MITIPSERIRKNPKEPDNNNNKSEKEITIITVTIIQSVNDHYSPDGGGEDAPREREGVIISKAIIICIYIYIYIYVCTY